MPALAAPLAPLDAFLLDPAVLHLNHGSYGACPRAVLDAQQAIRARIEAATMRYFVRDWAADLAAARARAAAFVGADEAGFAFVPNATTGVATALAALAPRLAAGDELLTTDHAYRACRNALDRLAARTGARVVVAALPVPLAHASAATAAVLARVGDRTRVVLVDHVTSPSAIVLPVGELARALPATADLVVDGAHAPGMLDLDVGALTAAGVTYYTGNFHKWTCAPRGAAFLHVAAHRRDGFHPLVTSHGASLPTAGTTRFRLEHDWTGTHDPSAYLAVPAALDAVARLGGGWPAVRAHLHALARAFADGLAERLGASPIAAPGLLGTMAAVAIELPDGADALAVERALLDDGVEVPIIPARPTGVAPWALLRISAHLYNHTGDLDRLLAALTRHRVRGHRVTIAA
jgi:isopenicillin-N epimerase